MDIDFTQLLTMLGTLSTGGLVGYLSKSGRIKSKADANKAMAEDYEYRIESLHKVIETCNTTIKELQERIALLNHALDDKTEMIRKYVADIMKAERGLNEANARLIEAEKEIAE